VIRKKTLIKEEMIIGETVVEEEMIVGEEVAVAGKTVTKATMKPHASGETTMAPGLSSHG
jgi:hypothetical protein